VDAAYPVRADGKRLLAFPRLFCGPAPSMTKDCPPRAGLLDAQAGGTQRLPVCDHYSGVEARMRKSLQLQAEMMAEFGACVFDVTLDCEDGAPVGQEPQHARLVAELARNAAPGARWRPGCMPWTMRLSADMDIIAGEAGTALPHHDSQGGVGG
jgi:citrate lyase subunit beta/citryl-CoA lyase